MAANGNEVITIKQAKVALDKLGAKQATETSYGTVKLISDEDLDAYINPEYETFNVTMQNSRFKVSQSDCRLSDGKVSISVTIGCIFGTGSLQNADLVFSIPSEYAPNSHETLSVSSSSGISGRTAFVNNEGSIIYSSSSSLQISYGDTITFEGEYMISEPSATATGDEIITVEQLKNLISNSGGGGSDENQEEELFSGYASEYDLFANTADINKYSELVITVYPSGEERIDLTDGERFRTSTPYGYFVFDVNDGTLTWTTQTKYFTRVVGILK